MKSFKSYFVGDYFIILNQVEYLAYYLAIPFFASFQQIIFRMNLKRYSYIFLDCSSLFSLVVLLFDSFIYTHTALYYHIYVLFFMGYSTFVMIKATMHNRDGAKILLLLGMFMLFGVTINDILHSKTIIQTEYMAPYMIVWFYFYSIHNALMILEKDLDMEKI